MKQIRHLLKKDWLALRMQISLWFAVLLLSLLLDLNPSPNESISMVIQNLLLIPTCIFFAIIIVQIIGEDTPAKQERFLSTRPVNHRQLLLAKCLFITAVIVIPLVFRHTLYLLLSGQETRIIFLGGLQTLLWAAPLAALTTGFASMWESKGQAIIAAVITVSVGWGLALLIVISIARPSENGGRLDEPLVLIAASIVAATGFLLILSNANLLRRSFPMRLLFTGIILIATISSWVLLPIRGKTIQPPQNQTCSVPSTGSLDPTNSEHKITWIGTSDKKRIGLNITPDRPDELHPAAEIHWKTTRAQFGDQIYQAPQLKLGKMILSNFGSLNASQIQCAEAHIGNNVQWIDSNATREMARSVNYSSSQITNIPQDKSFRANPNSKSAKPLSAELTGIIYQWQVIGDIPLKSGSLAENTYGTITITDIQPNIHTQGTSITMLRTWRNLWLSPHWEDRNTLYSIAKHIIYHSKSGKALPVSRYHTQHFQKIASSSAYLKQAIRIDLDPSTLQALAPHPLGELRLLVLAPRYLKTITRSWQSSKNIRPASIRRPQQNRSHGDNERHLTLGEFSVWHRNTAKPSTQSASKEFQQYLLKVLEKTSRCRRHIDQEHPVVTDLARFVPKYLELFIRAKRYVTQHDHVSRNVIDAALTAGVQEKQLPDLLNALYQDWSLLRVIERRGWLKEALPILLEQWHLGNRDRRMISYLARLPECRSLHPEILAAFRRKPDTYTYRILSTVPELKGELDSIVRELWSMSKTFTFRERENTENLRIALIHGLPDALHTLHRMSQATSHSPDHYHSAAEIIKECIDLNHLAGGNHHHYRKIVLWFMATNLKNYSFDPISRKFIYSTH